MEGCVSEMCFVGSVPKLRPQGMKHIKNRAKRSCLSHLHHVWVLGVEELCHDGCLLGYLSVCVVPVAVNLSIVNQHEQH